MRLFLSNLIVRWRELRVHWRQRHDGTGINVPMQLDEWRDREAKERVRRELVDLYERRRRR